MAKKKVSFSSFSIITLIFGIISFMLISPFGLWALIDIIFALLTIIFGATALKDIKSNNKGKGLVIAGLILGIIAVLLDIIMLFVQL